MLTARENRQNGLTLVELLVVVVILAILALAVFMVIGPVVLSRVRDTIRMSDLEILQKAMSEYSTDKGYYPPAKSYGGPWICPLTLSPDNNCLILQQDLAPYLSKPIHDPLDKVLEMGTNTNCSQSPCYMYGTEPADHSYYCVCTTLEGDIPQGKTPFCANLVPYGNYCVTNTSN